ncbi:MAG TPA: MFS transporter, partial [Acidimicrobiales bacterium]
RLARRGLIAFAALLAVFAGLRTAAAAYPVVLLLGCAYFTTTTGMLSALQEHLDDAVRGRVMALWMMGFGGTVPLGLLAFGKLADVIGRRGHATPGTLTAVLLLGAVVAAAMAAANTMGAGPGVAREPAGPPTRQPATARRSLRPPMPLRRYERS